MKLAFTTLGCPKWNLDTIIAKAKELGYDGVDFRGYMGEIQIYKLPEFTTRVKETAKRFADAGLDVPCFASSARIYAKPKEAIEEIRQYAAICKVFNTRLIRVFGGEIKNTPSAEAVKVAAQTLKEAAPIAKDHGVKLVLETHDSWLDCQLVKSVMDSVNSPQVGVLWDVHHPYRMIDEAPEKTWAALGKWIAYTHVKDSRLKPTPPGKERDYQLCLPGDGEIPLKQIFAVLKKGGYQGYLTLEWEKQWHPDIEEPEVAFPRYVEVVRRLL